MMRLILIGVLIIMTIFLFGCAVNNQNIEAGFFSSEVKFCSSVNMEFNDTYSINACKMVACKNVTGISTYKFCNSKDGDGLGTGLLIGYLVFGGR